MDREEICIVKNKDVGFGFLEVYENSIKGNGYRTRVIKDKYGDSCEIISVYSATYTFNYAIYLGKANIKIYRNYVLIGEVKYKANHISPFKFKSAKNKIESMVNELLPKV